MSLSIPVPLASLASPRPSSASARSGMKTLSVTQSPRKLASLLSPRAPQRPCTSPEVGMKPWPSRSPSPRPPARSRSTTASPSPSLRPPSPLPPACQPGSGRSSPAQVSPLTRRYDLKPPVPSASQGSSTPASTQIKHAELLCQIQQMQQTEMSSQVKVLLESILAIHTEAGLRQEVVILSEALQQRVSELFSCMPLHMLSLASDVLLLISEHTEDLPGLRSDGLSRLLEARLEHFLHQSSRLLEARLEHCLHPNKASHGCFGEELEHLIQCHEKASSLAHLGLCRLKSEKKALEHLVRFIPHVPVGELQHRAASLCKPGEPAIMEAILLRIRKVELRGHNSKELRSLVVALKNLHRKLGLFTFDASLESSLCTELPFLVKAWTVERLMTECEPEAGLLQLCEASNAVGECVNSAISERLSEWICDIVWSIRQTKNLEKAQADTLVWKQVAQRATAAGILAFGTAARSRAIDVFSRCYDECVAAPDLVSVAEEVDRLLFQVAVIMGADRRFGPATSSIRKVDVSAKGALPPVIRVMSC